MAAINRHLDYLDKAGPDVRPRCYISRVDKSCRRCDLCPLFVAPEHRDTPHPCWHIKDEDGRTIWQAIILLEEGYLTEQEYNRIYNAGVKPVLLGMREAVRKLIDGLEEDHA